jgi:PadR family transcriptional regulator, regulatory protein PadR
MPSMTGHKDQASREAALLQGTLDMLVLKVLAIEPLHGYGIAARLQQISKEALQIRQGSLYPALYRLESRGWLRAEWRTTDEGRDAKYYRLTAAGRRQLDEQQASWQRLTDAIALVLSIRES